MVTRPELGRSRRRILEGSPSARLTELFPAVAVSVLSREPAHEGEAFSRERGVRKSARPYPDRTSPCLGDWKLQEVI